MRTQLIEKSSRLYIRRIVREINNALRVGGAIYAKSYPFNIYVLSVTAAKYRREIIYRDSSGMTHSCAPDSFVDGHGKEIAASRMP